MFALLLLCVIAPAAGDTDPAIAPALAGGIFIRAAFEQRSERIQTDLIDSNTGKWIDSVYADIRPRITINGASDSIDVVNHRLAVDIKSSEDGNKVFVFGYNATAVWTEVDCILPNALAAQCVVFSEGRLFIIATEGRFSRKPGDVYEYKFAASTSSNDTNDTNGSIPTTGFCNVTKLAENPYRVYGTLSGPGGQCGAIPSHSKLVWVNAYGRLGILFDYSPSNATFEELENLGNGSFTGRSFDMIQDPANESVMIIHDGDPSIGNINTNVTLIYANATSETRQFHFPQVSGYTFMDSSDAVVIAGLEVDWPSNTDYNNGIYNATDGTVLQSHPKVYLDDVFPDIMPLTLGTGYDPTINALGNGGTGTGLNTASSSTTALDTGPPTPQPSATSTAMGIESLPTIAAATSSPSNAATVVFSQGTVGSSAATETEATETEEMATSSATTSPTEALVLIMTTSPTSAMPVSSPSYIPPIEESLAAGTSGGNIYKLSILAVAVQLLSL